MNKKVKNNEGFKINQNHSEIKNNCNYVYPRLRNYGNIKLFLYRMLMKNTNNS